MSEIERKGRQAEHELSLTEAAHATYRKEQIEKAIALASKGMRDEAYTKLLMVVAIDSIRAVVHSHIDTVTIETKAAEATNPAKQSS